MSNTLDQAIEVPDFIRFRQAVDHIWNVRNRIIVQIAYLTASRVSEMITKVTPWDLEHHKSRAYGKSMAWKLVSFDKKGKDNPEDFEKVLLITSAVAKRTKKMKDDTVRYTLKTVALPCSRKYEPWSLDIINYLIRTEGKISFDLTRFRIFTIVKDSLRDLDPHIHPHSLRHYRLTHLMSEYNFEPAHLSGIAGWTLKTAYGQIGIQTSSMMETYVHLAWKKYFPLLLVPRFDVNKDDK